MRRIALLESEKHVESGGAGPAASIALHVVVLAFAIAVTSHAWTPVENHRLDYVPLVHWHPEPVLQAPRTQSLSRPNDGRIRHVTVQIPTVIPPAAPTPAIDLALVAAASAPSAPTTGASSGTGSPTSVERSDDPLSADEVDVAASVLSGQRGPAYPESLRMAGVEGHVVARFIIDTSGRVERDPIIVSATQQQFADAVKRFLANARYRPATKNGGPVRQLAEQEFDFAISR